MPYTDVFISHKAEDREKAERLRDLIQSWNFSCYIDADDAELQRIEDPKEMAQHIRNNLRGCRVLIYAFSSASPRSRWMPWELGFFDGRWGSRQIALYDLDEPDPSSPTARQEPASDDALSLQEYLEIYTLVDRSTLPAFLEDRTSTTALSNRADVDADRLAALIAGALRNPVDFSVGCFQYWLSFQQAFWRQSERVGGGYPGFDPLDAVQRSLGYWRGFARVFEPPDAVAAVTEDTARGTAGLDEVAVEKTASAP